MTRPPAAWRLTSAAALVQCADPLASRAVPTGDGPRAHSKRLHHCVRSVPDDWHVASEVPNATRRARAGTLVQNRQLAPPALLPSVELGADENIDRGLQRAHQTERATDKALRL
jgi:hypothetical protein